MKQTLTIALTIFLIGCGSRPQIQMDAVGLIDISKSLVDGEKVLLSSIAERVKYIELQSDSNCLLDRIDIPVEDIKVHNNRIFIADQSRILSFDINGKFITQIGSQGRGPGEYMYPDHFAILHESERVAVFSEPSKKVYFYTLNGSFEKDIDIDFFPTSMISYQNKLVFVSPPGRRNLTDYFTLTIMDENGEIYTQIIERNFEKEVEKNKNIKIALSTPYQIYLMDSSLYYYEKYYDTIWRVSSDFIVDSKTHFYYGENKKTIDFLILDPDKKNASDAQILLEAMNFVIPQWYIDSPHYTFFRLVNMGKLNHIVYNKYTNDSKSLLFKSDSGLNFSFFNDLDGGLPFWPDGLLNDKSVIKLIHGVKLKQYVSENKNFFLTISEEKRVAIQNIISHADPNDNPILMIVELK